MKTCGNSLGRILGKRVAELEKKLKTLEVAGLWTLPAGSGAGARNAAFLAKEKQNMASGLKTLLPHQVSSSSDDSPRSLDGNLSQGSSTRSTPHSTPSHGISHKELLRKDTEDSLILLEETDGTAEATESRSRSQSSPTRHDQVGVELTRRDTDRNLVAVEGQKTLVKVRSMSQDSPSHRCHQTDLVKADTENSLITLEDNHENFLGEDSSSDPWQVPPGEKRTSEDDEGSGRCIDINERDASGGGDAHGNVNASAERALLKNIFEIERGRADGSDDHLDDVTCNGSNKDDEETLDDLDAAIEPEDQETDLQEEGDKLMSSWMEADGDPSTGATISTSSLENLFDSVADRLTLKNKEKIQLERTESTQPSSPLLKRDKPTHLVVVDNTPQCV
ncbi:uncharacterized protein LOC135156090 [Lytechinus pictus]|uniref:uncharacterized protein LOC135156090 n=1 Tax=Lytechinus pictus TaxID=7653 RepID=UPI0030BA01A6